MKAKYRKFDLRRHKYGFWLRFIQTLDYGVRELSKLCHNAKIREHRQKDYEHNQRRKLAIRQRERTKT